jgi:hypothetical protein
VLNADTDLTQNGHFDDFQKSRVKNRAKKEGFSAEAPKKDEVGKYGFFQKGPFLGLQKAHLTPILSQEGFSRGSDFEGRKSKTELNHFSRGPKTSKMTKKGSKMSFFKVFQCLIGLFQGLKS